MGQWKYHHKALDPLEAIHSVVCMYSWGCAHDTIRETRKGQQRYVDLKASKQQRSGGYGLWTFLIFNSNFRWGSSVTSNTFDVHQSICNGRHSTHDGLPKFIRNLRFSYEICDLIAAIPRFHYLSDSPLLSTCVTTSLD